MKAIPSMMLLLAFTVVGFVAHAEQGREHVEEEVQKGPHGGRLVSEDGFAVELTIFESGVEPEFRAYAFENDVPLDLARVSLTVDLTRLNGDVTRFDFAPRADYLLGSGVVAEPHSFVVAVNAAFAGRTYRWTYDSFEGRTSLARDAAAAAGIEVGISGPAVIRQTLPLHGIVVPDPTRVFVLQARYPGVVREVRKRIGDTVAAGETVMVVESNESLQRYNITSPGAGVVVSRGVNPGMLAADDHLMTVADLSTVWVELAAFEHDVDDIASGQSVTVYDVDHHRSAVGTVGSIAPVGSSASQSMTARVVLPNADGRWRPGLFVTGEVVTAEVPVPIAVERAALQSFRDWTVVFERVDDTYEIRPLELGRADGERVEVLGGLAAGATYVTASSYLIKADLEKSGASHDH